MARQALAFLVDTNVLLRLSQRKSPEFTLIRNAVGSLRHAQIPLYYVAQNLVEFWNVSTRPTAQNGYGLSLADTDQAARRIEKLFILLPEVEAIHQEWRRLVVKYGVSGVKVHDARLVAAMFVYRIGRILTLNARDFDRYKAIESVHPSDIARYL